MVKAAFCTRINDLTLTHFRNYDTLKLSFNGAFIVFTGNNGEGKTNLLEALSLLTPGRGLRRAAYADIAHADKDGDWAVAARLDSEHGDTHIGTGVHIGSEGVRRTRINRANTASAEALLDYLRIIWLTPAMDGLFMGSASDRRRFLDRMVLTLDKSHGRRVNAFDKALRARNKILETDYNNRAWLDAAEVQVAELGTAVAIARRDLVSHLMGEIAGRHESPFPTAELALEGSVDEMVANMDATDAEDAYLRHLNEGRARDRAAGRTLEGPHRSDLHVTLTAKNMPARLCSTGEQKALLLTLVLAHGQLVTHLSGMTPVLLLDEVAAHLDEGRRAALFTELEAMGCQVFMTGTDAALFTALEGKYQRLHIADGVAG